MKKRRGIFVVYLLVCLLGCQNLDKTVDVNVFIEKFITDFLTTTDEVNDSLTLYEAQLNEEIQPYFTDFGYLNFEKDNYIVIPGEISKIYQSNISVQNISSEEIYNEDKSKGYLLDVQLQTSSEIINIMVNIRVEKLHNEWKINSINFINIDDFISL